MYRNDLNLDGVDTEGNAALHYSILNGYLECVQSLLDVGVDVNLKGRDSKTPAMLAVLNDQPACLEKLIEKDADLTIKDCNNQNVLHFAIKSEKIECLKILLRHPDWNVLDKSVYRAETLAVEHRKLNSLKALIEGGVDISKDDREHYFTRDPVMRATVNNDIECLTFLVQNGAFLNNMSLRNGGSPVTHASFRGYEKCLEILLDAGASMKEQVTNGQSALHLAACAGRVKCMEMLLEKSTATDLNKQDGLGCTAFWYAAFHGNYECLQMLARAGADYKMVRNGRGVIGRGVSPIEMAAEHLHVCDKCVSRVTCACYDLCAQRDRFCRCKTCLELNKTCECVQQCLGFIVKLAKEDFGADTVAFRAYISKCLRRVIQFDRGGALKMLLQEGVDLSQLDFPLHLTCSHQSISSLKVLLSYGQTFCEGQVPLDPNARDLDGRDLDEDVPVIFWAADAGWHQGVQALIHAGADVNFRNTAQPNFEATALLQCLNGGRSCFVAKVLLHHGASATLQPSDTVRLHFMNCRIRLDVARLLLAAGFPKTAIKSALEHPECDKYFVTAAVEEKYKREAPVFISQLTGITTLQDQVRGAIGARLMSLHPDTNLFCLVPKLPLPTPLREYLLHGETLSLPSDNSDIGNEMTMLLSL